jgi:hypothetical protein
MAKHSDAEQKTRIDYSKKVFSTSEKEYIRKEVEVVRQKYSSYIPIIIRTKSRDLQLTKYKYLVGGDVTIGQFMTILRKKMTKKMFAESGLYLFVDNNTLPPTSEMLCMTYMSHKDNETNVLFMTLCQENTFG